MDVGRKRRLAVLAALAALAAGCGGSSTTNRAISPSPTHGTVAPSAPRGLIAIGHSGLTGESSDAEHPNEEAKENSWATGDNPAVNSIFQRLVALDPAAKGRVANTAEGGAKATALLSQAQDALASVATPQLAIIQTIDNDIGCDGTDAANAPVFGAAVQSALDVIASRSPKTKILVLSQIGRPLEYAAALARIPSAVAARQGTAPCDLFDQQGRLSPTHAAHLTSLVELYETTLKRVCLTVPQCRFDNGAFARFQDRVDYFAPGDTNHLSVAGQARAAALLWPTVQQVLQSG